MTGKENLAVAVEQAKMWKTLLSLYNAETYTVRSTVEDGGILWRAVHGFSWVRKTARFFHNFHRSSTGFTRGVFPPAVENMSKTTISEGETPRFAVEDAQSRAQMRRVTKQRIRRRTTTRQHLRRLVQPCSGERASQRILRVLRSCPRL